MRQDVAKADRVRPDFIGMSLPKVVRQSPAGLADNLEVLNAPNSYQFTLVKPGSALPGIPLDLFDCVAHVGQAKPVVSHKGSASRSTVWRTRSRNPRAEITSTFTGRICSSLRCSLARSNRLRPGSRS